MGMRLKRLYNDHLEISKAFAGHPYILIKDVFGNPPEKYLIEYKVKGLTRNNNNLFKRGSHLVEIILPSEYPGAEPICRMSDPAFHPNIDSNKICIADYWAAGESLVDVIVRIGEIICYQNYNIKSPLNGEAANWARQNTHRFPLDTAELSVQREPEEFGLTEKEAEAAPHTAEKKESIKRECSNCGAVVRDLVVHECINGHVTCPDCNAECQKCGKTLCVLCPLNKCTACGKVFCDKCKITCPLCGNVTCEEHLGECCVCQCGAKGKEIKLQKCSNGHLACPDCILECQECGRLLCVSCTLVRCSTCGKILCSKCESRCPTCGKTSCKDHRDCCAKPEEHIVQKAKIASHEVPTAVVSKKSIERKSIYCGMCGNKIQDSAALFCEMCGHELPQ